MRRTSIVGEHWQMRLLLVFATAIAAIFVSAGSAWAQTTAEKPNIVLVFMDNFGWGEPGFNLQNPMVDPNATSIARPKGR